MQKWPGGLRGRERSHERGGLGVAAEGNGTIDRDGVKRVVHQGRGRRERQDIRTGQGGSAWDNSRVPTDGNNIRSGSGCGKRFVKRDNDGCIAGHLDCAAGGTNAYNLGRSQIDRRKVNLPGLQQLATEHVGDLTGHVEYERSAIGHLALQRHGLAIGGERRSHGQGSRAVQDGDSACAGQRFAEREHESLIDCDAGSSIGRIARDEGQRVAVESNSAEAYSLAVRSEQLAFNGGDPVCRWIVDEHGEGAKGNADSSEGPVVLCLEGDGARAWQTDADSGADGGRNPVGTQHQSSDRSARLNLNRELCGLTWDYTPRGGAVQSETANISAEFRGERPGQNLWHREGAICGRGQK